MLERQPCHGEGIGEAKPERPLIRVSTRDRCSLDRKGPENLGTSNWYREVSIAWNRRSAAEVLDAPDAVGDHKIGFEATADRRKSCRLWRSVAVRSCG